MPIFEQDIPWVSGIFVQNTQDQTKLTHYCDLSGSVNISYELRENYFVLN